MNFALFIARRMGYEQTGKGFSGLIKTISILSISLGLSVMILAVAVVTGFQQEIRDKVIGFGSHIQISHIDAFYSVENRPISREQDFLPELQQLPGVRHTQVFASKPGILKTEEDIQGVLLKGVGPDFDWSFFGHHMVAGNKLSWQEEQRSDGIVLSALMARKLRLAPGDRVNLYFIQDPPRIRRLEIAGLYDTGLEELDKVFVLGDIRHIQRLNDWEEDQVGGIEVLVADYRMIPKLTEQILEMLPYDLDIRNIRQLFPQIFDWLALLDMNVYVILALMVAVAGINMITTLLIAILDKTRLIGTLKALGAANKLLRKMFLYHAGMMVARGLLIGNLIGLSLAWIQGRYGIIKLSQESYYVSEVPVNLEWIHLVLLNLGTFAICMMMLLIPSTLISRITPVKSMEFR